MKLITVNKDSYFDLEKVEKITIEKETFSEKRYSLNFYSDYAESKKIEVFEGTKEECETVLNNVNDYLKLKEHENGR